MTSQCAVIADAFRQGVTFDARTGLATRSFSFIDVKLNPHAVKAVVALQNS